MNVAEIELGDLADADRLTARCRRTGDWGPAALWLARRLNAIDYATPLDRAQPLARRLERAELMNQHVAAVDGDHREPDQVRLPDGTRVCWHLGVGQRRTRWAVERAGERCAYPRGS